jgi:hypothetical protein
MPGIHWTSPVEEIPHNLIVSLPPHIVNSVFDSDIDVIENGWPYFPPIPPHIRRVWIYETEPTTAITCVIKMTAQSHVLHLYQLLDPIPIVLPLGIPEEKLC